jgi:single-stranded-DNA-specific exonuclease
MRAPEGYDLGELLDLARPYLLTGGGHRLAAGMSFHLSQVDFVRRTLVRGAEAQVAEIAIRSTRVDSLGSTDIPSADDLDLLEPWGQGFPGPVAALEGCLAKAPEAFGGSHARLRLDTVAEPLTWFSAGERALNYRQGQRLAFVAAPQDHPRWGRNWVVEGTLELPQS